ncbi:unnamed protein product [Boreogadus saida]
MTATAWDSRPIPLVSCEGTGPLHHPETYEVPVGENKDALEGSGNAGIIFGWMWKCRVMQEEGKERGPRELVNVAREREVWGPLLELLPPRPDPG